MTNIHTRFYIQIREYPSTRILAAALQNVAQYPLNHVTYPATKFEVARSNRLGGDTFTRKYII